MRKAQEYVLCCISKPNKIHHAPKGSSFSGDWIKALHSTRILPYPNRCNQHLRRLCCIHGMRGTYDGCENDDARKRASRQGSEQLIQRSLMILIVRMTLEILVRFFSSNNEATSISSVNHAIQLSCWRKTITWLHGSLYGISKLGAAVTAVCFAHA